MRDMPRFFAGDIANMRAGLARGFTPPAVTLGGRDKSIEAFTAAGPAPMPFYGAFKHHALEHPRGRGGQLRAEGKAAIEQAVMPAYRDLLSFYRDTYVPGARSTSRRAICPMAMLITAPEIREYTTLAFDAPRTSTSWASRKWRASTPT